MKLRPFLKWAGGKRWLVDRSEFSVPHYSGTYIEPFLGGGAVFFSLLPSTAILSDANGRLIETYIALRDDVIGLIERLAEHDTLHSKSYYYETRDRSYSSPTERAAQFIYLNRACWNGLYRVNRKGQFNVPIGTKDWILSKEDQFHELSAALRAADLRVSDFAETIDGAKSGDLVFVDPPYTTAHNMNGFVKYNSSIFSWQDQQRLRTSIEQATGRGVTVIMTNADHESIHELYHGIGRSIVIGRHSVIAGPSQSRRATTEALFVFEA